MTQGNERIETGQDLPRAPHGLLALMTAVAVATLGYHPYAEDGGVYLAGVKRLLNPALYPHFTEFVTEHLRFSLFAPALAALTRLLHLGLPWTLLLVYVGSIWLLLYAAWQVAARCFPAPYEAWARAGAVGLTAAWCSLPIAGTSLMLMDPYVTARSIATPLVLLAVAAALDLRGQRAYSLLRCGLWLGLVACLHPLMAAYALGFVALIACEQVERQVVRRWAPVLFGVAALLVAGALQFAARPESAAQTAVAMTRYYWFPWRWESYELIGLAAPLVILTALVRFSLRERAAINLGAAAVSLGVISALVGFLFARPEMASHVVARLQPMRCFQMVYLVMMILLGGWIAQRWLRQKTVWAGVVLVLAACGPFFGQRQYYPASSHLELPGRTPRNRWVQAFQWIRKNTPIDATFAMDANYITTDGEDAQCFRAIAERSAVPDYSKDGGETSITPALTDAWTAGSTAQKDLGKQTDSQRKERLLPLGVSWVILKSEAATDLACPYANGTVKVCRLR